MNIKLRNILYPILIGSAISFPLAYLSLLSAGSGHGDYIIARIIYPYAFLSVFYLNGSSLFNATLAIIQYPIYSILLWNRNIIGLSIIAIFGIAHFIGVIVSFLIKV